MRPPGHPAIMRTLRLVGGAGARRTSTSLHAAPTPASSPTPKTFVEWWRDFPYKDVFMVVVPCVVTGVVAGLVDHALVKSDLGYVKESQNKLEAKLDRLSDKVDKHMENMQKDVVDLKVQQAVQEYRIKASRFVGREWEVGGEGGGGEAEVVRWEWLHGGGGGDKLSS